MNFEQELSEKVRQIEDVISTYLPKEEGYQKRVISAMNYSVMGGGKRLRPMLMQETYRLSGGSGRVVEPFMAALEMIHTYSLVHDDLPAMDNDEYRRGRKTTHVVYGEAIAILAGDALLNFAFETACRAFSLEPDNSGIPEALSILAGKAGIYGMIGGQTADIEAEGKQDAVTGELIAYIHDKKTAALIQSAMMIGAVLAGAAREVVEKLERIAFLTGLAFQIQDDILDVTGDTAVLGKPVGSDEKNRKVTYVTLEGLEKAKEDVKKLSEEAVSLLEQLPGSNPFLQKLLLSLITREK